MITENLSTLKIHKLSQAQYDRELEAGRIEPNALYLTPDDVDLSGYATKDELKNITAEDVGAPTMEYTKKVGAPHNMLDNSDFRNPVNQRGQTKYTGNVYCLDRWVMWSTNNKMTTEIKNGYVHCWNGDTSDGTLCQKFKSGTFDKSKTYTLVSMETNGNVYIQNDAIYYNSDGNTEDINIPFTANQTRMIKWAALYEGEYTAETIPEY